MRETLDQMIGISEAARRMGVSRQTLSAALNGRRAVTPSLALRFGRLTGRDARPYLEIQLELDLWREDRRLSQSLAAIKPVDW
jgi:addiction module HigA family antidote